MPIEYFFFLLVIGHSVIFQLCTWLACVKFLITDFLNFDSDYFIYFFLAAMWIKHWSWECCPGTDLLLRCG